MSTSGTWTSWTFRAKNNAYKEIRPISMKIVEKTITQKVSGIWIFSKYRVIPTDRWEMVLTYDKGPCTKIRSDCIAFDSFLEAEECFYRLYDTIFSQNSPPTGVRSYTAKSKKSHLHIVKDRI